MGFRVLSLGASGSLGFGIEGLGAMVGVRISSLIQELWRLRIFGVSGAGLTALSCFPYHSLSFRVALPSEP